MKSSHAAAVAALHSKLQAAPAACAVCARASHDAHRVRERETALRAIINEQHATIETLHAERQAVDAALSEREQQLADMKRILQR